MSFSDSVTAWFTSVENLLDDGPLDYSEVRELSDEGYALIRKLRARIRHLTFFFSKPRPLGRGGGQELWDAYEEGRLEVINAVLRKLRGVRV